MNKTDSFRGLSFVFSMIYTFIFPPENLKVSFLLLEGLTLPIITGRYMLRAPDLKYIYIFVNTKLSMLLPASLILRFSVPVSTVLQTLQPDFCGCRFPNSPTGINFVPVNHLTGTSACRLSFWRVPVFKPVSDVVESRYKVEIKINLTMPSIRRSQFINCKINTRRLTGITRYNILHKI